MFPFNGITQFESEKENHFFFAQQQNPINWNKNFYQSLNPSSPNDRKRKTFHQSDDIVPNLDFGETQHHPIFTVKRRRKNEFRLLSNSSPIPINDVDSDMIDSEIHHSSLVPHIKSQHCYSFTDQESENKHVPEKKLVSQHSEKPISDSKNNEGRFLSRLHKELKDLSSNSVNQYFSFQVIGDEISHWGGEISGPNYSLYRKGIFKIEILFPNNYPFDPPRVHFLTKIFHPSVSEQGEINLPCLYPENWTLNKVMISSVIQEICFLLSHPEEETHPLNLNAAHLFAVNRSEYEFVVNECIHRWAKFNN